MATPNFIPILTPQTGGSFKQVLVEAISVSTGLSGSPPTAPQDAGKIVRLNANGQLDPSLGAGGGGGGGSVFSVNGQTGTVVLQLSQTFPLVPTEFLTSYNASTGLFTAAQPTYADISGTPQLAQTFTPLANEFLTGYTAGTGVFTAAQPSFSNLSGSIATGQIAALTVTVAQINASGTPSSSTFLRGDGTWATVSASPSGSSGDIQYNNGGVFGGSATTITAGGTISMPTGQNFILGNDIVFWRGGVGQLIVAQSNGTYGGGEVVSATFLAYNAGGAGNIAIGAGDSTHSGYVTWQNPSNAQFAYMGFDTDYPNLTLHMTGGGTFIVPNVHITGTLADGANSVGTSGYVLSSTGTGTAWVPQTGGSSAFSSITTGTNVSATMTVGSGASIVVSGTGIVEATQVQAVVVSATPPTAGQVLTATSSTAANWQSPTASGSYATTIGDGSSLVYTVTHNLGTEDIVVEVHTIPTGSPPFAGEMEIVDVTIVDANTVTVTYGVAPALNSERVVVLSSGGTAGGGGSSSALTELAVNTGTRSGGTVYQNTTGKTIIAIVAGAPSGGNQMVGYVDSSASPTQIVCQRDAWHGPGGATTMFMVIPNNYYYEAFFASGGGISQWREFSVTTGTISVAGDLGPSGSNTRLTNTAYQNTSGSLMFVLATYTSCSSTLQGLVDTSPTPTTVVWSDNPPTGGTADYILMPVLPGEYYIASSSSGTLATWFEYTWSGVTATKMQANTGGYNSRGISNSVGSPYFLPNTNATTKMRWVQVYSNNGSGGDRAMYSGEGMTYIWDAVTSGSVCSVACPVAPGWLYTWEFNSGSGLGSPNGWWEWTIG